MVSIDLKSTEVKASGGVEVTGDGNPDNVGVKKLKWPCVAATVGRNANNGDNAGVKRL